MTKGRKGQHGVGLAIKESIVKKAGEDGITIECISARFLKDRILIKSNFVTSLVAYAPTEEAPEGQKAKYMAALNCTVASVPAREYVFVLTDANGRTEKRGEGRGETDSKVLGAYGRDKLNENEQGCQKMGTYFEMGTDGHRFVCFQTGISWLQRHLWGVSIQLLVRPTCSNGGVSRLA